MAGIPEGWQPGALRWSDCSLPRGGECATLGVPLDWQQPEGRQIELALGRIAAKGESIGSLVMNPGGPGGSGLELLSWDPTTEAVSDRFDLVSWDPRGVGRSTAVDCEIGVEEFQSIDPDPDDDSELAGLESGAAKIAGACGDDVELLAHVGTADVARDLEAIRRALGDEELNYLGFSYGTHIGQVYAAMYPTRIRAMVLDGVVDPALGYEEFLLGQAAAFEEVFDDNVRACAEAGPGRCGVDDLAAAYDEVLAAVESEPLPGGDRPVGPAELTTAALQTGYGEEAGAAWARPLPRPSKGTAGPSGGWPTPTTRRGATPATPQWCAPTPLRPPAPRPTGSSPHEHGRPRPGSAALWPTSSRPAPPGPRSRPVPHGRSSPRAHRPYS